MGNLYTGPGGPALQFLCWRIRPKVIFQPGFTPLNVFEDQQLYFGDSDGDGDLDVTIVSLIPTLGSTVEKFHQTGNGFVLFSALLTYQKSVRCLEYFDFSGGDG